MPRRAVLPLLLILLMLVPLVVAQYPPIDPPFPTDRPSETPTPTASESATASATSTTIETATSSATNTETLISSETATASEVVTVTDTVTPSETATSTETATFTASSTATPSATATSTAEPTDFAEVTETLAFDSLVENVTPTPTITPLLIAAWCYEFDFSDTTFAETWTIPDPPNRGFYAPGDGFVAEENIEGPNRNTAVQIRRNFAQTELTRIVLTYDYQRGTHSSAGLLVFDTSEANPFISGEGVNGLDSVAVWTGQRTAGSLTVQVAPDASFDGSSPDGSGIIRKVRLEGVVSSPFGNNCTPSPTATPTSTPTRTPNPNACLQVNVSLLNITEGGSSASYNVRLSSAPAAGETVTITPSTSPLDEITLSPANRQLNTSNWDTGRNFTVNAVDDTIPEVLEFVTITHNATSTVTTSVYNGAVACQNLTIRIAANDGSTWTPTFTPTRTPTRTRTPTPTPTLPICLPRFGDGAERTEEASQQVRCPEVTHTPTPTAFPTITPGGCQFTISQPLRLRLSPTRNSPEVLTMPGNINLTAVYRLTVGADVWYQTSYNGRTGWAGVFVGGTQYATNLSCSSVLSTPYPAGWEQVAQVQASDLIGCSIDNYFRSEPPALVLARLAYGEAGVYERVPADLINSGGVVFADASRIAWIARLDAFMGLPQYGTGYAGRTVPIIDQILTNNAFAVIGELRTRIPQVGCDPEDLLEDDSRKVIYPENSQEEVQLYELWVIYQDVVTSIIASPWNNMPIDLRGYDQFKGVEQPTPCPSGANNLTRPGSGFSWATNQPYPPQTVMPFYEPTYGAVYGGFPGSDQAFITCYQDIYHLDDWFWDALVNNPALANSITFPREFCVKDLIRPDVTPPDVYPLAQLRGLDGSPFPSGTPNNPNCTIIP